MSGFELLLVANICLTLSAQPFVLPTTKIDAGSKMTRNSLDWCPYSFIWEGLCVLSVCDETAQYSRIILDIQITDNLFSKTWNLDFALGQKTHYAAQWKWRQHVVMWRGKASLKIQEVTALWAVPFSSVSKESQLFSRSHWNIFFSRTSQKTL